ncbi:hypothetical protein FHP25_28380 [Vineibacter terrae]|uniref:Uncharacterized protein n=1 Tax=Vineibacter terrae TaxID=2586908 RepID=A0A5C8PDI9_9HYPH|nr:hypothetical protein [Vineibacter terrae]TXL71788.1 hypothetical protein FHP25_28380 [Vineibacter terrae]
MAVIVSMEAIDFSRQADPLGTYWLKSRGFSANPPQRRAMGSARVPALDAWVAAASRRLAREDAPAEAVLLGVAACLHGNLVCDARLAAPANGEALARASGAWTDGIEGAVALVAATRLALSGDVSGTALAPPRAAARALRTAALTGLAPGHRQFAARAAAIVGREMPRARSYIDLRNVFMDDGRVVISGSTQQRRLEEGLALLATVFPPDGVASRLSWRAMRAAADDAKDIAPGTLAMWWALFDSASLPQPLAARSPGGSSVTAEAGDALSPHDAARILLAVAYVRQGPLLEIGQ